LEEWNLGFKEFLPFQEFLCNKDNATALAQRKMESVARRDFEPVLVNPQTFDF
jgi:hypothetical protein